MTNRKDAFWLERKDRSNVVFVNVSSFGQVIAEVVGTYFVIFAGCGSVVVNKQYGGVVTFPGICVTWGLIVMVMVYSVGHISGAHFNPAVTITFTIFRRFPLKQAGLFLFLLFNAPILTIIHAPFEP